MEVYVCYKCVRCRKEFVLLSEEVQSVARDRYIACPYCNSKKVSKENMADSLRECMKERSYKRVKGALRQK